MSASPVQTTTATAATAAAVTTASAAREQQEDTGSGPIAALHHDSTSSSDASTPRVRTPVLFQTMHVDVHEHERWFPVIGWATSRLADDPPVFTPVLYGARALGLPPATTHTTTATTAVAVAAGEDTTRARGALTSTVAAFQRAMYASDYGGGAGVSPPPTPRNGTAHTTAAAAATATTSMTTTRLSPHTPVRPLAVRLPAGYRWDGYWEVYTRHPHGTDDAGWRYATAFSADAVTDTTTTTTDTVQEQQQQEQQQQQQRHARVHFKKTQTPVCVVRYRTWRRRVRHAEATTNTATTATAATAASLAPEQQHNNNDSGDDDDDDEAVEANKLYLRDKQAEMALAEALKQQRVDALRAGRQWTADDDLAAEEQLRAFTRARRVQSRQQSTIQRHRTMNVSSASFANPFRLDAAPADPDDSTCPVTISSSEGGDDGSTATGATATGADANAAAHFTHRTGALAAAASWAMPAHDDNNANSGGDNNTHGEAGNNAAALSRAAPAVSSAELLAESMKEQQLRDSFRRSAGGTSPFAQSPRGVTHALPHGEGGDHVTTTDSKDSSDNNSSARPHPHRSHRSSSSSRQQQQTSAHDADDNDTAAAAAAALHDHVVPPHYHREAQTTHGNAPAHGTDGQVPGTAQVPVREFVHASPRDVPPATTSNAAGSNKDATTTTEATAAAEAGVAPYTLTNAVVVGANDGGGDDFDAIFQKFVSNPESAE